MTEISAEAVGRFLLQEGTIGVMDPAGVMRMLHPWLSEYVDLAQTANRLWHNKTWHSREAFLQLCAECPAESQSASSLEAGDAELGNRAAIVA